MNTKIAIAAAALLASAFSIGSAGAAEDVKFLLSWKAQAEHGGYFQAKAKGYYEQCGVNLQLHQGGPGIDNVQLLAGGAVDIALLPYIDSVLQLNQSGFPARAIFASFQRSVMILMTHNGNGIEKLEDMRGKPVMIAATSRQTIWPFLRANYGFTDDQIRSYSSQMAPFLADTNAIQQGVITNEPYLAKKAGVDPKVFMLADNGYLSYGSIVVTSQKFIDEKPDLVRCVVEAFGKGWVDFLADPKPAFDLIKQTEPQNTDDLMENTFKVIKEKNLVETDETKQFGIGIMTDARWKAQYELMRSQNLIGEMDYKVGFDAHYVADAPSK